MLKIGDFLYHPCSIDIIHHKITSIRQFEGFNHYVLKSLHNVGACGRLEVIVDEHNGHLRFVELLDEDDLEYASGLQDFIVGDYYTTLVEAKIKYFEQQETLASVNMNQKERFFKESKARYEQVKLLVKALKEELKLTNNEKV